MNAFTVVLLIVLGLLALAAIAAFFRPSRSTFDRRRQETAAADAEYRAGPRNLPPLGGPLGPGGM